MLQGQKYDFKNGFNGERESMLTGVKIEIENILGNGKQAEQR